MALLSARRKSRDSTETFVTLSLEEDLAPEFLCIFVEPEPEFALSPVDIARLQLDSDCLIRLASDDEVLVVWIGLFHPLLVCAHDTDLGSDAGCEVWKLKLKQQSVLARVRVAHFCDAVPGSSNLDDVLLGHHSGK